MNIPLQHLKKLSFILFLFFILILSSVISVIAFQRETTYVSIRPQVYNGVLSNPGIGFTTMGAFDSEVEGYPKSAIYQLNISSNVEIKIYTIEGQLIKILINEYNPAGYYSVSWDGINDNGIKVPSGIYIYKIKAGDNFEKSKKMIYLK